MHRIFSRLWQLGCYFDPDDGAGAGDPDPANNPGNADPPKPPATTPDTSTKTFSEDYVRALREENKSYRLQLKEASQKLASATGTTDEVNSLKAQIRDLTVGTAVESALKDAGAISPDLLIKAGVIDLATIELGADGKPDPKKLAAAIEEVKKSRAELFGAPKRPDVDAGVKGSTNAGNTMNDLIRRGAGH